MADFFLHLLKETWLLASQMAPYLFLGFILAGLLHVFLPLQLVSRHLGGESPLVVLKAAVFGIPLPLCSCGVLPVAAELRNAGAGKAPTLSFLITTPVTGVDSILATWGILGPIFTFARVLISIIIGITTGLTMSVLKDTAKPPATAGSFCDSCVTEKNHKNKLIASLKYTFIEMPESLAGSMLLGLLLGGFISAAIPPGFIEEHLGTGIIGILSAIAVAIPLYVCASGSIPIAVAMMFGGFSPGAALAFLIAGPATNAVAVTTVKKFLGTKALVIYLANIFIGSLAFGLLFDLLIATSPSLSHDMHSHHLPEGLSWFSIASGVLLLLLLGFFYIKDKAKRWLIPSKIGEIDMKNKIQLSVPDMTCHHCERTVKETLKRFDEVEKVEVNLSTKKVLISLSSAIETQKLIEALSLAGYKATSE